MNRIVSTSLYFIAGAGTGFFVGYFIAKKSAEVRAAEDIQSVKDHYAVKAVKESPDFKEINDIFLERYGAAIDRLGYNGSAEDLEKMVSNNAPAQEFISKLVGEIADEADMDAEDDLDQTPEELVIQKKVDKFRDLSDKRSNSSSEPYVLSIEEYMEEEAHEKITLTYFDEDETLINEREEIITDVIRVLGPDALTNFGVGSDDDNIVYVRDDRNSLDFEVILDPRSYMEVVLGERPEKKGPKKMREDFE